MNTNKNTSIKFNSLSFEEKGAMIFSKDCFVASVEYYGKTHGLYQIENFYVEVVYDEDPNEIISIEAFETKDKKLDKYSNTVSLDNLLYL